MARRLPSKVLPSRVLPSRALAEGTLDGSLDQKIPEASGVQRKAKTGRLGHVKPAILCFRKIVVDQAAGLDRRIVPFNMPAIGQASLSNRIASSPTAFPVFA